MLPAHVPTDAAVPWCPLLALEQAHVHQSLRRFRFALGAVIQTLLIKPFPPQHPPTQWAREELQRVHSLPLLGRASRTRNAHTRTRTVHLELKIRIAKLKKVSLELEMHTLEREPSI